MRHLALLLLAAALPAMDLMTPVAAYWHLRGPLAEAAEHHDLTIHLIGTATGDGRPVSLFYYCFGISGDEDGGEQRERELLLVMNGERLHGWYQITGTDRTFALAQVVGQEVVLPDGFRRTIWPLPTVLSETLAVDGAQQTRSYLLHLAPAP